MSSATKDVPQIYGHPAGLFTLFFTEMWERFSYYGMRALLLYYMIKGFLGLNDSSAYQIYGAYTALVYATPYFGGILADRVLGRRRAVVLGGLLMAAGHLLMMYEHPTVFFIALAFLIVGNGFFKPNISTIVGELYPKTSDKKDAGFTIFYMGINLGAAMSPIICGYVGETYGWHFGFGLATAGMLVGVAMFVMPTRLTQITLAAGVLGTSIALPFLQDSMLQLGVRLFMVVMLLTAGVVAVRALNVGPLPAWAGAPPSMEALTKKIGGFLRADYAIYAGAVVVVFVVAQIVQNKQIAAIVLNGVGLLAFGYLAYEAIFKCKKVERERLFVVIVLAIFHTSFWAFFEQAGTSLSNWTDRNIDRVFEDRKVADNEVGTTIEFRVTPKVEASSPLYKMPVVTQEQLGHVNADPAMKDLIGKAVRRVEGSRNEMRPEAERVPDEVIEKLVQDVKDEKRFTMTGLTYLRAAAKPSSEDAAEVAAAKEFEVVKWHVAPESAGMGIAQAEIPGSEYQAANPVYILLFGLLFSALWTYLGRRQRDPTAPVKFAIGLAQLSAGFFIFWYGAKNADVRGMSSMSYLLIGWILITTGELCISPVGLSMVTKLAPKRLVSTVMGVWFVSITYANYIAAIIATVTSPGQEGQSKLSLIGSTLVDIFTGAGHGDGGLQIIPPPQDTVNTYGDVFGMIAQIALGAAVVCFLLKWTLNKWMHADVADDDDDDAAAEAA